MSEFKFACPVCGQHITADSQAAGSRLQCPTCFRKIVVPQAPSAADPKFILSATTADKPRPTQTIVPLVPATEPNARSPFPIALVATAALIAGVGVALFVFRGHIFKSTKNTVPNPNSTPAAAERKHGAVGLAAWNTRVEYTNLAVKKGSRTLFQSDFTAGAPGWQFRNGAWTTAGGVFRQTAIATDCRAIIGDTAWRDYTVTLRARKLAGREGFIIMFNVVDDQNWTWWNVGGWGNTRHAVESCVGGVKTTLGTSVNGRIETNHWYDVRVELKGDRVRCYLDNQLVHEVRYASPQPSQQVTATEMH